MDYSSIQSGAGANAQRLAIHPVMLELLPDTYGVMVYQEDVLRVAHDLAGMSYAEADLLRRAMSGKMRSRDTMEKIRLKFFAGVMSHGLSEDDANEIWRQISSFAGYSFCKGHSAAFAVLSYRVAYLKAHHPAEFFAALLSNGGGFYGAGAYIQEARRWQIEILLPCVNESDALYVGRTIRAYLPDDNSARGYVRIGLCAVHGVSEHSRNAILDERSCGGRFRSLQDFITRVDLGQEEFRTLARVGALDLLEDMSGPHEDVHSRRPGILFRLECLLRERELNRDGFLQSESSARFINGKAGRKMHADNFLPSGTGISDWTPCEVCAAEAEILGYMVSLHPLDFVDIPEGVVHAADIRQYPGKRIRMAGWGIATKLIATRNKGETMKMLTLEDHSGTFEAVLFPRAYKKFSTRTITSGPYIVTGKVDIKLGSPTLNVDDIAVLPRRKRNEPCE